MTFRNLDTERIKGKRSYRQRVDAEHLAEQEIEEFSLEELEEDIPDDDILL
ncbi:MAG TPA: hypothetical protein VFM18_21370 [Methanosarcina sp.]|nr:hypothetical protein [Methanosarcina sp.]